MSSFFAIQITNGCLTSDIEQNDKENFTFLQNIGAVREVDGLWKFNDSMYRIGKLYLSKEGRGFLEASSKEFQDLLIEPENLLDANAGDIVVAKRIIAKRGRASAKVVVILSKARLYQIVYTNLNELGNFEIIDIKTSLPTTAFMRGVDLKILKNNTVLKVDISTSEAIEIMGNLSDPKIDEKISLALFNRFDKFEPDSITQALKVPSVVDVAFELSQNPNRVDLRELDFCTIDPVTAKDFDDAIYFDTKEHTLYVAIADVSHYVDYYTPIDIEAKQRGFTTYLPHKSFPMLQRELSENICSLKPHTPRLAFVAKIKLDKNLKVLEESFFEAIIHSKRRFNYDEIDAILATHGKNVTDINDKLILEFLFPLYNVTQKLRDERLSKGFDFRSEEIKISINANHELTKTTIETGTPSHSLIEECMLLANRASAKRFEVGIFRIHDAPQLSSIEELLVSLKSVGIEVEEYEDSPDLIRAIQRKARDLGLESEVDGMIIKSLKQASYSSKNSGHFGLGFEHYSHFTSPIRRYSDLILHRLIKTQLYDNIEEREYLLRNIDAMCARVSHLERETTKTEWDFRDRKFARWAKERVDNEFKAQVIEIKDSTAKALIEDDVVNGVVVTIMSSDLMLFDSVLVKITSSNIASKQILATVMQKLTKDINEL